jgi:hypothetical protein
MPPSAVRAGAALRRAMKPKRMMPEGGVTQVTGGVPHLLLKGARLADTRFDDGHRVVWTQSLT